MWFKCKHPAERLIVESEETRRQIDADFERVEYHLQCRACMEPVTVVYARMIGGTEAFLARGEPAANG